MTNLMKICLFFISPFSICMILQDMHQFFFSKFHELFGPYYTDMQTSCDSCEIETRRGLLYNLGELGLQTVCVIRKTITCVKEK